MGHKWDDWRDYVTLQERMNRLFEDTAQRHNHLNEEREAELERADWTPASDVYETEGEFVIAIDLPGIERGALEVSIDENRLTVRGERKQPEDAGTRRGSGGRGRPFGRFLSRFGPLPPTVDQKNISADYKDGVLILRLPKRTERKAGRVKIAVS
ncbi:MAG TPA: Hsp20/alpha crystallin family protein [Pyrinomonadaceae bacterium]|nr:Hsp20/alpha crystallin family protein [Pyrinomonadaceae bacterium]